MVAQKDQNDGNWIAQAIKKANKIRIYLSNDLVDGVLIFDYLCVRITNILSWDQHVNKFCQRIYPKLGYLNRKSSFLPKAIFLRIYKQTIQPVLDYGSMVWHECGSSQAKKIEKVQNHAMRIIPHHGRSKCTQEMRNELKLMSLYSRRRFLRFVTILKILRNLNSPDQLRDTFQFRRNRHDRDLRDKTLLELLKGKGAIGQSTFKYPGAKDWNFLPSIFREMTSITSSLSYHVKHVGIYYAFSSIGSRSPRHRSHCNANDITGNKGPCHLPSSVFPSRIQVRSSI